MPVTVYIWDSHGTEAVGHASLALSDGTYISWWPHSDAKKRLPTGHTKISKASPNPTLEDDIRDEDGQKPTSINVGGLNENAIKKWWMDFKTKETEWRLLDQNCSTVVFEALCAGGALERLPGDTAAVYRIRPVWFPAAVKKLANDLNSMATYHKTEMDARRLNSYLTSSFVQPEL